MEVCVVCQKVAQLYCKEDCVNLCINCDKIVHEANSTHNRIPITDLNVQNVQNVYDVAAVQMGGVVAGSENTSYETAVVPQVDGVSDQQLQGRGNEQQQELEFDVLKNDFNDFFKELDSPNKEEIFPKEWEERLEMGHNRVAMNFDTMDMLFGQKEGGDESQEHDVGSLLDPVPTGSPDKQMRCLMKTPHRLPKLNGIVNPTVQKVDSTMSTQTQQFYGDVTPVFGIHHMMASNGVECNKRDNFQNNAPPIQQQIIIQPRQDPDRAAKLARYRAKRARRNFKKTIRYESRKAYAEIRPRIKGRFAAKAEVEAMKLQGEIIEGGMVKTPDFTPSNTPSNQYPQFQVNEFIQGIEQFSQGQYMVVPMQQQQ